jgi:hypothetical protein
VRGRTDIMMRARGQALFADHARARIETTLASGGAFAAMIAVVPNAFLAAYLARLGAQRANLRGQFTTASEVGRGQPA